METLTSDERAIIDTLVSQARRSEGWKVQKLIAELRRRIDNQLPIPAGNATVRVEVAEAIIIAVQPFTH